MSPCHNSVYSIGRGEGYIESGRIVLLVLVLSACAFRAEADALHGLDQLKVSSMGAASEDRRLDKKIFGIRVGCEGDVVIAKVRIVEVKVSIRHDGAHAQLSYVGEYVRQGWGVPCVEVSPLFNGVEFKTISGKYNFLMKIGVNGKPNLTEEMASELQPVADPEHDSNILAVQAVRNAIVLP